MVSCVNLPINYPIKQDSDDHTASSSDSDLEKQTPKSTQLKRQPALSASKRKQVCDRSFDNALVG